MSARPSEHEQPSGAAALRDPSIGRVPLNLARLGVALVAVAVLFGGLPQSSAVRTQLARTGLVSSGRPDLLPPPTTTTVPPPPVQPLEVESQLAASGYPDIRAVELDRVVTLTGTIPDEASRRVIVELVRDLPGVDAVIDQTTIATAGPAADAEIVGSSSRVVLEGAVPDQGTAAAVLDAVQQVYLADQIDGAITVDPSIPVPARLSVSIETSRPELSQRLGEAFDTIDPASVDVDFRSIALEVPPLEAELEAVLDAAPIEFSVGSATVDEASQPALDAIAAVLVRFPDAVVEVGGHTDDTGGSQANRSLSSDRAASVIAELRARGIENDLVAAGYGEARPKVIPAASDEARAANRRIEFLLIEP